MAVERYFSVCTMGDCEPSDTVNITQSTTAGTYVSSRQPGSIRLAGGVVAYIETPVFLDASSATTFFTVFNHYWNNSSTSFNSGVWFEAINSTGTVVFRIRTTGSGGSAMVAEFWNGATYTTVGSAFSLPLSTLNRLHIALVCGASGSVTIKNASVVKVTGSITSASCNNVAKCRLYANGASGGEIVQFGEWAGANFDLQDLVIRYDPPTGASATNTAWTGTYTEVDEANRDDTDMISSGSAGDRESYTHASYTVPTGIEIDSVWVAGRGRVNGAGPTDAKYMIRQSSTNYDSSALVLAAGFATRARYWATDPATSAKFTQSGYNSAEFGVVSI